MKTFLIIVFTLLIIGCQQNDKYQIVTAETKIFRLNKNTGEIVVISKDGIQKYDDKYLEQDSELNQLRKDEERFFPESSKEMWSTLSYKWRNNKILFKYKFGPYSEILHKKFDEGINSVTLIFDDEDGFEIASTKIMLSSLTRVVGDDGNPEYWSYEDYVKCSKDDYLLIKDWSLPWIFTKSLKSSIRGVAKELSKKYRINLDKIKNLIKNEIILGKIDGDNLFIKSRTGYMPLEKKLVPYIIKNAEEFGMLQRQALTSPTDTTENQ
ncbi:MAG: hypothetical protein H8D22_05070 [Candidatus Cloacimonetes bacterium]|nr:hypothetical protein [Candidatus Cloacimonadota bacterium]